VRRCTGYARRGPRVFGLHGEVSWTRNCVLAAIASIGGCFTALHERSVDGTGSLECFVRPGFPSRHGFVMVNIAFHKSAAEWGSLRFRVLRTAHSPRRLPKTTPVILGYSTGARKRSETSKEPHATRQGRVVRDEASVPVSRGGARRRRRRSPRMFGTRIGTSEKS